MLNAVNINYLIIALVAGALLLAAIYHGVLFYHRKTLLLGHYTSYLIITFVYIAYRFCYPYGNLPQRPIFEYLNTDETLQMFSFAAYIRFIGTALDLEAVKDRYAFFFTVRSPQVIIGYIVLGIVLVNIASASYVYLFFKFLIRCLLLFVGLFLLLSVIVNRKKLYYNYLGAGAVSMIIFGLISTVVTIIDPSKIFTINSLSWLMIGFFSDVIFFSSAIGYKIKTDANEKEYALQMLIQQNEILQQKEIEKIQAIFKTREEERLRIANDLHDDIGASLSSLQIYGSIAEGTVENNPAKAIEMVRRISLQSRVLMENMNDIVWSMKTSADSGTTLEAKIKNFGSELLSDKNIFFTYNIDDTVETLLYNIRARKNILLLIKEAMNNIAKYSSATKASLTICIDDDQVKLFIHDNGVGFNTANSTTGNGLKNMHSRINELKGKIKFESVLSEGVSITAKIPLSSL